MTKYTDPMDDILDRPIAYNPALKRITGSTNAAILLSQAWYWTKRTKDKDGWFYKTRDEWSEETALTANEIDGARKVCRELGVIEEKLKGVPATLYYRINKPKIYSLLGVQIPTSSESSVHENSQIPEKQESDEAGNINKEPETTPTNTTSIKKGDLIDGYLELYNMPGAKKSARLDSIKSLIGTKLRINPTGRKWEEFCRFADDRMQQDGQDVADFLNWMTSQKGFEIQYWPPDKMRTMWPQAFTHIPEQSKPEETWKNEDWRDAAVNYG